MKTPSMHVKNEPTKEEKLIEGKQHFDDLHRAEMIKADPEKMAKVRMHMGDLQKSMKSVKKIKSVGDLKDTYDEKYGQGALDRKKGESEPDADDMV